MLYAGLLVTFMLGFTLINALSLRFSLIEKAGLSFIVGMAFQTLLMVVIDALGLPLNISTITGACLLVIAALGGFLFKTRREEIKRLFGQKPNLSGISLAWLLLLGIVVWLEYLNFAKCIYFPTFDRDALDGYDAFGFLMAKEHTLRHCTAFNPDYFPLNQYMIYPQLVQLAYTWVYLLGAEVSKYINALMFLSFIVLFYGSLRRVTRPLPAMTATLFMMVTPELMAWSSMSALNVIHAIYASMALIYLFLWFKQGKRKDFWLSALLMSFNVWARADGVAIVAGGAFVLLVEAIRRKQYRDFLLWSSTALSIYVVWSVLCKLYGFKMQAGFIITTLFWDSEKCTAILNHFISLFGNLQYFGFTFPVFAVAVLANGYFIVRKKEPYWLLLSWVASLGALFVMYYQMEHWGGLQLTLESSLKRYLFCFIPVMWFYIGNNRLTNRLFEMVERFLHPTQYPN